VVHCMRPEKKSMSQAEVVTARAVTRSRPRLIPTLRKIGPVAALSIAVIVTGSWITLLGFGIYRLIF
jgi:hypothetical protein